MHIKSQRQIFMVVINNMSWTTCAIHISPSQSLTCTAYLKDTILGCKFSAQTHHTTQPEPDLVFRVQVDISDLTNRWVRCGSNMFLLVFNQPYKTILQVTHGAHKNTEANLHGHQQYILDLNSRPEHITTQPEPELVI